MSWQTADAAPMWWGEALADFGRNLGFENFSGSDSVVHNFTIGEGKYLLDIECSSDNVTLAVLRELPAGQVEEKLRSLLQRCNFDRYLPFFVQTGLKGSSVATLAIHLERSQADRMFHAFELMREIYTAAGV